MADSLFGDLEIKPKSVAKPKRNVKKTVLADSINLSSNQMFGDEFDIKVVNKASKLQKSDESVEKQLKSKKLSLNERLAIINTNVLKVLGKQKPNVLVIKDKNILTAYINSAIESGRIAIDTETNNSLDPITCKLMGPCFYYPGGKQAYVPLNHRNPDTKERFSWQLTEQDIAEALQKIIDSKIDIVMHNGKFDYKVLYCTTGKKVVPTWDTLICAKVLDENEFSAGLKQQYISKIDKSQEKYSIDHLFENVEYADVDPDIFALYAATDSMMTDKLYLWQKPRLEAYKNEPGPYGKSAYDLFKEVEMPCVISTAQMELNGIRFDTEYANRLRNKFETELASIDSKIDEIMAGYSKEIASWRINKANAQPTRVYVPAKTKMSQEKIELTYPYIEENTGLRYKLGKAKAERLEDPISLASPVQLAILLFDILKLDNDGDRATGGEVLEKLKSQTPLAALLLERRSVVKMLDAFINSLPESVNPKTGKIHCNFNQYGAATGRFSCSAPNLQQIPSHMKSIRMLFTADPGYKLIGSDFSQQEVRVLAELSKDKNLINAYNQNKDIYATVASGVYHMDYWDCMEHYEDGSPNPEGKNRRASCKSIVLGIMYSRGAAAIAEQIGSTREEAQKIIDDFNKSFPTVKSWMDKSLSDLRQKEYVEDFYGRRRRLPDVNLKPYTVEVKGSELTFNPFIGCEDRAVDTPEMKAKKDKWLNKIAEKVEASQRFQREAAAKGGREFKSNDEMSMKQFEKLQKEALADGVIIQAYTGRRAQAERQCVNSRIQGSSATMTKIAMNKITKDPELAKYGFKMCISVHDELIGEVKEEFAEEGAARLCEIMKTCVSDIFTVGFKCDPSIIFKWYEDEMAYSLQDKFKDMIASGKSKEEARSILIESNSEFLPEEIDNLLAFE